MQPATHCFCVGFECISNVDWNRSVSQFMGVWPWPLTFRGHRRSKIFSPFESSYMTSNLNYIDTFSLSCTDFEIIDFKVLRVEPWPLEVTWGQKYFHHSKTHTWLPILLLLTLFLYLVPFQNIRLQLQRRQSDVKLTSTGLPRFSGTIF